MDKRTKEAARHVIDCLKLMDGEDVRIVSEFLEREIEEADTICAIRWTEDDYNGTFRRKYGREPTEEEYESFLSHVNNLKFLEAMNFEKGWANMSEMV